MPLMPRTWRRFSRQPLAESGAARVCTSLHLYASSLDTAHPYPAGDAAQPGASPATANRYIGQYGPGVGDTRAIWAVGPLPSQSLVSGHDMDMDILRSCDTGHFSAPALSTLHLIQHHEEPSRRPRRAAHTRRTPPLAHHRPEPQAGTQPARTRGWRGADRRRGILRRHADAHRSSTQEHACICAFRRGSSSLIGGSVRHPPRDRAPLRLARRLRRGRARAASRIRR